MPFLDLHILMTGLHLSKMYKKEIMYYVYKSQKDSTPKNEII